MTEARFDRAGIRGFLAIAGDRLDGDWLLIGGGAAADWFAPARTTEDIDLIGLAGTQRERLALMDLAAAVALPVEAVNSAADYYVRRIDDWREHLVVHHRGSRATIYRPDATLFLLLKLGRLSEVDLGDCAGLLAHCERSGEIVDRVRVRAAVERLPAADGEAAKARRDRLCALL